MRRRARESAPRRAALSALALLLVTLSACVFRHGAETERWEEIRRPTGQVAGFVIRVVPPSPDAFPRVYMSGEVLDVREDGVLVATDSGFLHVLRRAITNIVNPEVGSPDLLEPRYPYGLDHTQLMRLLRESGFERVDTVGVDPAAGGTVEADTTTSGGPDPGVLRDFLTRAREAAEPYQSLERAVAEGYRLLGPAFPGMGEHWIHPGLIVEDRVTPDRPPVLCYAPVDGERQLIGLAFAVPLEANEPPPAYPAGRAAWHDHADHVDEEVLLLSHPGSHHGSDGPRLAMFHAWLWLENPDGVLAQNNWRLPFLQAGVDPSGLHPSADAARALSLHTAGPEYYLRLFRAAAAPAPEEMAALREVLQGHARAAAGLAGTSSGTSEPPDLGRLEGLWDELWAEIEAAVRPETFRTLAVLR